MTSIDVLGGTRVDTVNGFFAFTTWRTTEELIYMRALLNVGATHRYVYWVKCSGFYMPVGHDSVGIEPDWALRLIEHLLQQREVA